MLYLMQKTLNDEKAINYKSYPYVSSGQKTKLTKAVPLSENIHFWDSLGKNICLITSPTPKKKYL